MKVGIIGGGASGTLVAAQLVRRGLSAAQISIFDRSGSCGFGAAYGASTDSYVLNVPAGKMSAFPDTPSHFSDWLVQRGLVAESEAASRFVSRRWYGQYLHDLITDVKLETKEVDGVHLGSEVFEIDGRAFDHVVLALGNAEATLPAQFSGYRDHPGFRNSTWKNLPNEIASEDRVLVIGTGLSMLDVLCELASRDFCGHVTAVSRHGLLPRSHQPTTPIPYTGAASVAEILRHIRNSEDWRAAVDGLRPDSQAIWQRLPVKEKRKFLRHLRPYWEVHRHRAPASSYQLAQEWIEAGRLRIHLASEFDASETQFDWVFNATGPSQRLESRKVPVIESLFQRGLASYDELGLGLDPKSLHPGLYALGTLTLGTLWECTAVPDIRNQAAAIAAQILPATR